MKYFIAAILMALGFQTMEASTPNNEAYQQAKYQYDVPGVFVVWGTQLDTVDMIYTFRCFTRGPIPRDTTINLTADSIAVDNYYGKYKTAGEPSSYPVLTVWPTGTSGLFRYATTDQRVKYLPYKHEDSAQTDSQSRDPFEKLFPLLIISCLLYGLSIHSSTQKGQKEITFGLRIISFVFMVIWVVLLFTW